MSNAAMPPIRSKPTNAYVRPSIAATVSASGSGPLSSLRPSRFDSVWVELKNPGDASAVICSNASAESKVRSPVAAFQILNERVPKE